MEKFSQDNMYKKMQDSVISIHEKNLKNIVTNLETSVAHHVAGSLATASVRKE